MDAGVTFDIGAQAKRFVESCVVHAAAVVCNDDLELSIQDFPDVEVDVAGAGVDRVIRQIRQRSVVVVAHASERLKHLVGPRVVASVTRHAFLLCEKRKLWFGG